MAGGFAVIKDLAKTMVFKLARWRNAHDPYGTGALARFLSASSRARPVPSCARPEGPGQSAAVRGAGRYPGALYGKRRESWRPSSPQVTGRTDVERVTRLIKINEYKRRQAPVGIRVTHRSFGKDWRYPITKPFSGLSFYNGFADETNYRHRQTLQAGRSA